MPLRLTDPTTAAFVILPLALVAFLFRALLHANRAARVPAGVAARDLAIALATTVAWMGVTWLAASRGVLREWDRTPPPFALLVIGILSLAGALAFSDIGRRIARHVPLAALIGVQAFRLPLEVAMHELANRGVMPPQMTYTGLNFDIVTGATAIVVAVLVATGRAPRGLVLAWNLLGLALLTNVVTIAIASTPVFAAFGPDRLNVFVTYPPFVWLPAVLVLAALAGHLLIFRALSARRSAPPA